MSLKALQKALINLLPYIFVFLSSLYQPFDADLGWHLKYGQYFFQHGEILKTNIYSTDMAGFLWPNTNWFTDVLTYAIFNIGGFFALTLVSALIVTLTFWVFAKAFDLDYFQKSFIFLILVALEYPVNLISFRGQQLSILFLGVLIFLLRKISPRKNLLFLPVLFLFWSNIHGQFILGLGIFGMYLGFLLLTDLSENWPKINFSEIKHVLIKNKFLIYSLIFSFLVCLINPFGISTFTIASSHFNSPELKYILEYLPIDDLTNEWWKQMVFGIMLFCGALALFFSEKIKKYIPEIGLVSIFFVLSFLVRRYAWSMYYLGIPLLAPVADFIKPDTEKNANRAGIVFFIIFIACTLYLKAPFGQYLNMNWDTYCSKFNSCSAKSIEFIRDNNLTENLLSLYGWGGYMIWNYPEVKPSIDGRMTVWHDPKTGYSALGDYYAYEQDWKSIDNSKYNVVLMSPEKPLYDRLKKLVEEGKWKKVYEDDQAGVFVRTSK